MITIIKKFVAGFGKEKIEESNSIPAAQHLAIAEPVSAEIIEQVKTDIIEPIGLGISEPLLFDDNEVDDEDEYYRFKADNPIGLAKEVLAMYEKTGKIDYEAARGLIQFDTIHDIVEQLMPDGGYVGIGDHGPFVGHAHSVRDSKCRMVSIDFYGYDRGFEWSDVKGDSKGNCVIGLIEHVKGLTQDDAFIHLLKLMAGLELEETLWWRCNRKS